VCVGRGVSRDRGGARRQESYKAGHPATYLTCGVSGIRTRGGGSFGVVKVKLVPGMVSRKLSLGGVSGPPLYVVDEELTSPSGPLVGEVQGHHHVSCVHQTMFAGVR
jgi:hypothetical protein